MDIWHAVMGLKPLPGFGQEPAERQAQVETLFRAYGRKLLAKAIREWLSDPKVRVKSLGSFLKFGPGILGRYVREERLYHGGGG